MWSAMSRRNLLAAGWLYCLSAALLALLCAGCDSKGGTSAIVINEVVSSNKRSLTDAALGTPDWIELRNTTGRDIDLAGYRLTDKSDSRNCVLPSMVIPAGGYALVYADKNAAPSATSPSGACVIGMGLSSGGERLYLIDPENILAGELRLPALPSDVS
jgi:hypothetical protein